MELIEKLLSNNYIREDSICEAFYKLCSKNKQSMNIKKLFLKLDYKSNFNSRILSYGFLGALKNNQEEYLPIITNFMEKNNIKLNMHILTNSILVTPINKGTVENMNAILATDVILDYIEKSDIDLEKDRKLLEAIFNYATCSDNVELAKQLDEKFCLVKKSLNQNMPENIALEVSSNSLWATLNTKGELEFESVSGGEWSNDEILIAFYSLNPILFNLEHCNFKLLDTFFKNGDEINPTLVKHAVVKNIYMNNRESIFYLFFNEKCAEIIKSSDDIKSFIHSDKNFVGNKKEARSALTLIELKEKLPSRHDIINKFKI